MTHIHNVHTMRKQPHLLISTTLLILAWSACSSHPPKIEEKRELARIEQGGLTTHIDYTFSRAHLVQHERGCTNDYATTTEKVELFLRSPRHERPAFGMGNGDTVEAGPLYLRLYKDRNNEDQDSYRDTQARMMLEPNAQRLAYKIGDEPWQLVFVTSEHLLHAPPDTLKNAPLDWSKVPTMPELALPMWKAYDTLEEPFNERHRTIMMTHLRRDVDEDTLHEVLLTVMEVPAGRNTGWIATAKSLSLDKQKSLLAAIQQKRKAPDAPMHLEWWAKALQKNTDTSAPPRTE